MTTSTARIATWKSHAPSPHCHQNRAEIASGMDVWPRAGARSFFSPTPNDERPIETGRNVSSGWSLSRFDLANHERDGGGEL